MRVCAVAAALAAFIFASAHPSPSEAASQPPLQLIEQTPAGHVSTQPQRKQPRAVKPAPAEQEASAATAADTVAGPDAPLPVRTVRTTREPGTEETAAAILSGGLSGTARTEASSSLLTSTIVNYLGGPADIQAPEDIPASTEEFPEDARTAYAAEPVGQKPSEVALEYILMTFGGALAAASAIRLFVV